MKDKVVCITFDQEKIINKMTEMNYDMDAFFVFLEDQYGIVDGEDFQLSNGDSMLMYQSSIDRIGDKFNKMINDLQMEVAKDKSPNEKMNLSNWCIFENKICRYAKKIDNTFECKAPSDDAMLCK